MLRAFPVGETIAFFREIGVSLHEEAGGKLFPDTNRARDVLDRAAARERSAPARSSLAGHRVIDVVRMPADATPGGFRVVTDRGDLTAAAVVLATGGQSLPKSGSDGAGFAIARRLGHTIVPTTPALAPLLLDPTDAVHAAVVGRLARRRARGVDRRRGRDPADAARCCGRISASAVRWR